MYIERWAPRKVPRAQWLVIEEFVKGAFARVGGVDRKQVSAALRTITVFVLWARSVAIPLVEAAIFDIDVIERYVRVEYARLISEADESARSKSVMSLTSRLLTLIAMDVHAVHTLPNPLPEKVAFRTPYVESDMGWIRTWAGAQSTPERRQAAHAILGLCRGAGLTKSEMLSARNGDVVRDADGFVVRVQGENPRIVPIDRHWLGEMEKGLRAQTQDALIVFPTWTKREGSLKPLNGEHPRERVAPTRLRSTWITERLTYLPVDVLVRAAGFKAPGSLDAYTPHLRQFHELELVDALRGTL